MVGFDQRLFQDINGAVGRWDILDNVIKLLASDFFLPVVIALAAFALWFFGRSMEDRLISQKGFLYAAIGAGFANLFVRLFNQGFERPRPFITLEDVNVLFYRPTDPAFPSNAAAYAFAMAAGVWLVNRRWGLVLGIAATLFASARVVAGMHYPLDVVSGALLGILVTWLFAKLLNLVQPVLDWALRLLRVFWVA